MPTIEIVLLALMLTPLAWALIELIRARRMKRELPPDFTSVGETRPPKSGEWFINPRDH